MTEDIAEQFFKATLDKISYELQVLYFFGAREIILIKDDKQFNVTINTNKDLELRNNEVENENKCSYGL